MKRRATPILLALAVLALAALAATSGGGGAARPLRAGAIGAGMASASDVRARTSAPAGGASRPQQAHPPRKLAAAARARARPAQRSPGSLPQTAARPSAQTARFHALMRALWAGVATRSVAPALAAFFPRGAYLQLKAIPGAGADWRGRLLADFGLDLAAAHALVRDPAARLVAVDVPSSYAHWVPPGVCYNRVGYFEVPNARLVYSAHGALHSFGIASMISWRGVWYVVHLGAILRSSDTGQVDEPSSGRGLARYSGTC